MLDGAIDRHRKVVLRAARQAGATAPRALTMPAIERYTGVLYGELDWASLPRAARGRGADQVRIVSGLWGLVAPLDPIPPYKLKLSARDRKSVVSGKSVSVSVDLGGRRSITQKKNQYK